MQESPSLSCCVGDEMIVVEQLWRAVHALRPRTTRHIMCSGDLAMRRRRQRTHVVVEPGLADAGGRATMKGSLGLILAKCC